MDTVMDETTPTTEMTSEAAASAALGSSSTTPASERWIAVHPLSLVGMADQYTRTVSGGSPFAVTEPVVGLLFGTVTTIANATKSGNSGTIGDNVKVTVTHAEDVRITGRSDDAEARAARQSHLALHQAVFPHHTVVGWYRVVASSNANSNSSSSSPTPEDLLVSQQLAQEFGTATTTTDSATTPSPTPTTPKAPFLFALLLVESENGSGTKKPKGKMAVVAAAADAMNEDDDDDDGLPLKLFALNTTEQVLMGLDQDDAWMLATAVPERLAVERALREKSITNTTDSTKSSATVENLPVQQSLVAIQERLAVVEHYVQAALQGDVPWNHVLMRDIHGLLLQAGLLSSHGSRGTTTATSNNSYENVDDATVALLLQQVAALSTTVATVQEYTDNVRSIHADKQRQDQHRHHGGGGPGGGHGHGGGYNMPTSASSMRSGSSAFGRSVGGFFPGFKNS